MNAFLAAILGIAGCCAVPAFAQAPLFVDIKEGVAAPLAITVAETYGNLQFGNQSGQDAGIALAQIIRSDLSTSPFFRIVPAPAAAGDQDADLLRASLSSGTQALVIGRVSDFRDGAFTYSCALYDVFSGAVETTRDFRVAQAEWRRAAHKCADTVYLAATGYVGHFDTRFVLTAPAGDQDGLATRVITADFDGANPIELAQNPELVTMPRSSPDNRSVVFVAYKDSIPALVLVDAPTGRTITLRHPPGLPSAPRFSPDGQRLAFALSKDENTDIYEYVLATGQSVRLTDTTGIDTGPSYSPDGSSIVFESDRSGQQQIYIMRRDGSGQRRISFGGVHASPVWSPDGDRIAFTSVSPDGLRIGVMAADGSGSKIISAGPHDEGPSWAPSGRAISFQRTIPGRNSAELWIADIGGRTQHAVPLAVPGAEPHWSEVLP